MDIKSLVFRVQSDFSNANQGVDQFVDRFKQVDDMADRLGQKVADAMAKAVTTGKAPKLEGDAILPKSALESNISGLQSKMQGLYDLTAKLNREFAEAGQGGNAFKGAQNDLERINDLLEKTYAKSVQAQIGLGHLSNEKGLDPKAWNDANNAIDASAKGVEKVEQMIAKLGARGEVQFKLFGDVTGDVTKADDALKTVGEAITRLKTQADTLQGGFLSKMFAGNDVAKNSADVAKLGDTYDKLKEKLVAAEDSLDKMKQSGDPTGVQKIQETIQRLTGSLEDLGKVAKSQGKFGTMIEESTSLKNIMGEMTLSTALLATGFMGWFSVIQSGISVVKDIISEGVNWQQSMATLQGEMGVSSSTMAQLSTDAQRLAESTGQSATDIAQAFRPAIQVLNSYEAAQQAVSLGARDAAATQENVGEVTKGLVGIFHDYSTSVNDMGKVNEELFAGFQSSGAPSLAAFVEQVSKASSVTTAWHIPLTDIITTVAELDRAVPGANVNIDGLAKLIDRLAVPTDAAAKSLLTLDPALRQAFSAESLSRAGGLSDAIQKLVQVARTDPGVARQIVGMVGNANEALTINQQTVLGVDDAHQKLADTVSGKATPAQDAFARSTDTAKSAGDRIKQTFADVAKAIGGAGAAGVMKIIDAEEVRGESQTLGLLTSELGLTDKQIKELAEDGAKFHVGLAGFGPAVDMMTTLGIKGQEADDILKKVATTTQTPAQIIFPQDQGKFDFVDKFKDGAGEAANQTAQTAREVTASIATSISSIAKGVDDAMKLLSEGAHFTLPEDIEGRIKPMAEAMKKIYDTFATEFKSIATTNPILDAAVKSVQAEVETLIKMTDLYSKLPDVSVADKGDKIPQLIGGMKDINDKVTQAFKGFTTEQQGDTANAGAIAKNIGEEVKVLTDVAALYKGMEGVDLGQPQSSFQKLADTAAMISKLIQPVLDNIGPGTEQLGKAAQLLGQEATALKDVAALYKDMSGVSLDQPPTAFQTLASTAANINRLIQPTLQSIQGDPEMLGKVAELLGREATALKDVAALYKDMSGVDLNQPDSSFRQLATTAGKIHPLLAGVEQSITGDPEHLSKVAELLGREATALKDVAALYKDMSGVDLGEPDSSFQQLATTAGKIHPMLISAEQSVTGDPDKLSKIAELIGREATALKDVAALYKDMSGIDLGIPDESFRKLADTAAKINPLLSSTLQAVQGDPEKTSKVAELIGREATALKDTAALLKEMSGIDFSDDPTQHIQQLVGYLKNVNDALTPYFQGESHGADVSKLAESAGKIVSAVKDTASLLTAIATLPKFDNSEVNGQIDSIIKVLMDTLDYFDAQLVGVQHDPKMQQIATDGADVMKALGETVKMLNDLEALPVFSDSKIRGAIDAVVRVMISALQYFDQKIAGLKNDPLAAKVATDAGSVVDVIDKTIKVFQELGDKKKPLAFNAQVLTGAIDTAVKAAKQFIDQIHSSGISEGDVTEAGKFAENISKILEAAGKVGGGGGHETASTSVHAGPNGVGVSARTGFSGGKGKGGVADVSGLMGLFQQENGENGFGGRINGIAPANAPAPIGNPLSSAGGSRATVPTTPVAPPQKPDPWKQDTSKESTLNIDVMMDGDVIAKVVGSKMFNDQTLRAQLVPTRS